MGFSRPYYWGRLQFLSPGDLPYPGIEPAFPAMQADSLSSEQPGKSFKELGLGIQLLKFMLAGLFIICYATIHFWGYNIISF